MFSALLVAGLIGIVALLVALLPEILARVPRRRRQTGEGHLVRSDPDAPAPPARPDLKREFEDEA